MLEVGNGGMTTEEYRTHLSLWALLAAPLLAGNDLAQMTPETVALLTNRDIIAIDQDRAGHQGDRVWAEGKFEVWSRTLADGSKVVGLFNRHDIYDQIEVDVRKLGYTQPVKAHEVWADKDLGRLPLKWQVIVPGHDVILLHLWK
jgi:alpha-galactosidase